MCPAIYPGGTRNTAVKICTVPPKSGRVGSSNSAVDLNTLHRLECLWQHIVMVLSGHCIKRCSSRSGFQNVFVYGVKLMQCLLSFHIWKGWQ